MSSTRHSIEDRDIAVLEDRLANMAVPEPPTSVAEAWMTIPDGIAPRKTVSRRRARWLAVAPVAAAILMAAFMLIQRPAVTPALADVIRAAQNVRSVHFVSQWMETGFTTRHEFWASGNKWRKVQDGQLQEICDGEKVFHYQPSGKIVFTSSVERGPEMVYEMVTGLDLEQLNGAVEHGDLVVKRQEVMLDGRRYLLVNLSDKDGRFRYLIYADPQTKLAMRASIEQLKDGRYKPVWTIDGIEYNTQFDDRLFVAEVPKGWETREWTPPQDPYDRTTTLPSEVSGFGKDFRNGSYVMGYGINGAIFRDLSVALLDVRTGANDTLIVKFKTRGLSEWAKKDLFMRGVCVVDSDTRGQAAAFLAGGGPDDPPDRDLSIRDGIHVLTLERIRGPKGEIPSLVDVRFLTKAPKGTPAANCTESGRLPEPWVNTGSMYFYSVPVSW